MRRKGLCAAAMAVLFLSARVHDARAQAEGMKLEAGGHFVVLDYNAETSVTGPVQCIQPPCLVTTSVFAGSTEPGFGGRIGYNVTDHFALEAEVNFFPRDRFFEGGRKTQGLFGVRAGKRFESVGVFVKARPGFLHLGRGALVPPSDTACIAVFPPPPACFVTSGVTSFALDLGGVIELYPTKRTIIRFDAGDTFIHFGERRVAAPPSAVVTVTVPENTTHNFQGSVGVGFRF